jgi:subtilisin
LPVVSATLTDEVIQWLKGRPDVAYVEEDIRVYATEQTLPWGVDRIDADLVWRADLGNAGAGVDVAVLDTGIDGDHPDLNVAGGVDFTGQLMMDGSTRRTDWDDKEGHGTHCAGVIGARNNDIGVVGVAPEADIWAVKVLSDDRSGYVSDVIQGLEWCVDHGIEVASMSFEGADSMSLEKACDRAFAADVLLVAASGNSGGPVGCPAAYASVMAVSAVDAIGGLTDFSNTGVEIELAAPGANIRSTYRDGKYASLTGTSMACPHVAGAAALVWACPGLGLSGAASVRARLCETAEALDPLDASQVGHGLVDAGNAATPPSVVDLAVTQMVVANTGVEGDVIDVAVTLKNEGNQDVTESVQVALVLDAVVAGARSDDVVIDTESIGGLVVGASVTSTYTWDTTGYPGGSYTLMVCHDLSDDDMTDNSASRSVTLRAALTDIAVTAVSAPGSILQDTFVDVRVTVENLGDYPVRREIVIVASSDNTTALETGDDMAIGTQTMDDGLDAGESQVLTFVWDVGNAAVGTHTLTAHHSLSDDDAANDSCVVTVTVSDVASSAVAISYVTPRSLWVGMQGSLMIRGEGFRDGATVAFERGQGPAPIVTSVRVLGDTSLVGRVAVPEDVLSGPVSWDVRVTNPDGSSDVLAGAFTVQP